MQTEIYTVYSNSWQDIAGGEHGPGTAGGIASGFMRKILAYAVASSACSSCDFIITLMIN